MPANTGCSDCWALVTASGTLKHGSFTSKHSVILFKNLVQNRCMLSNAPQVEGSQIATSSSTAVDLEEIEQKLGIQEVCV